MLMKKIYHFLMMTVFALCLSIPSLGAEAASVALLPLINNVEGDTLASKIYFKSALGAINSQKGIVLVDNDQLNAVIEAAKLGSEVPDKATLAKIAKDGNVDLVIAMQLDVLKDEAIYDANDDRLKLDLQGYAVFYNKLTSEFDKHRIFDDKEIPAALASRWDWTHEEWGRNVKREVNRILKVKKVTVEAPRMSKL